MLVQQPVEFAAIVQCTECLGVMMGEAPHGAAVGHSGSTPMELGQAQGQDHAAYTPCRGFSGCCDGHRSAFGGAG